MSITKEWTDKWGFHCMVYKHEDGGFLCGYVGLPCEHPMYEKDYSQCLEGCTGVTETRFKRERTTWDCTHGFEGKRPHKSPEQVLDCHGGITYSGRGVPGQKEELWYLGFDCAHLGDTTKYIFDPDTTYKTEAYVVNEIEQLLKQVQEFVLSAPQTSQEPVTEQQS